MGYQYRSDAFHTELSRKFASAVERGDEADAISIAATIPDGVNVIGEHGETALLIAVEHLNVSMVDALIKNGAKPDGQPGRSPLALAVGAYDLSIARLLISHGADPNGRLKDEPAIFRAAFFGSTEAIKLLAEAKAHLDESDEIGSPATFAGARTDHWACVISLLNYGSAIDVANKAGFTIGSFAERSRLTPASENGFALQDFIGRWKRAGLPWPPPKASEVRAALAAGQWPPRKF